MLLLLSVSLAASAYRSQFNYQGIVYNVTSDNTVEVISNESYYYYYDDMPGYSGQIDIPEVVTATIDNYETFNVSYRVTAIAEGAFMNSTELTGVSIPKSVTRIGKNAFKGCTSLTSVSLPNSVDTIYAEAFSGCTALRSAQLPNALRFLGWNVFYGCSSLTNVNIPKSVRELNGTFAGCTSLQSVTIPASVTALDGTFKGCTALTAVDIPASVTYIGENTFMDCTSLTGVYIPNSVKHIGNLAFANTPLTTLEIPRTVSSLGENAFYGCVNLTSVTVRAINPPIMANSDCFSSAIYSNAALFVPAAGIDNYKTADWWNLFATDNVTGKSELDNAYDFEDDGLCYIITGPNTVSVTSREDRSGYSGYLGIPTSVYHDNKVYRVTGIARDAFHGCAALTGLNIPYTVTAIGAKAFEGCSGLTSLYLPETLTTIGDSAFLNCSGFTSLTVPQSVSIIGKDAFKGLSSLSSVTWNALCCWANGDLPTSGITRVIIGNGVEVLPKGFVAGSAITSVDIPTSVKSIGSTAFEGCTGITALTIPTSVTDIGENAFHGCNNLNTLAWNAVNCWTNGDMPTSGIAHITIGNTVEVIPFNFAMNSPITTINFPATVKSIGNNAFNRCANLTQVVIPDSVTTIGSMAFAGCTGITDLTIGKSVSNVVGDAFRNCTGLTTLTWNAINCWNHGSMPTTGLTQINIGDEVELIPMGFASGSQITEVILPNSVKWIGDYDYSNLTYYGPEGVIAPFENCKELTHVEFSDSLQSICSSAFRCCTKLASVVLPNSLTRLQSEAFYRCSSLSSLVLSDSLSAIGYMTFSYCTSLTSVDIPSSVRYIDEDAFYGCTSLTDVTLHEGLLYIYGWAFHGCSSLYNLTLPNSVKNLGRSFIGGTGISHLDLPAGLTRIGTNVFAGCQNLKTITIGPNIRDIDLYAFQNSGIESIVIPDNVQNIDSYAFADCNDLCSVYIGKGVTRLGRGPFRSCPSLTSLVVDKDNPKYDSRNNCNAIIETASNKLVVGCHVSTVPKTVTAIGNFAFGRCSGLTGITLPKNLTMIEAEAFRYCPDLTEVTCLATVPPEISTYAFGEPSDYTPITLYVPRQSAQTYRSTDIWNRFGVIIGIDVPDDPVETGDFDGDGVIGINDAVSLIDAILNGEPIDNPAADVNGDGIVGIADVTAILDMILDKD